VQPMATVLRRDLAKLPRNERAAFQDAERPQPPIAEDRNPVCGKGVDGFLPCRAIASLSAANAGGAADAPTVARWGYRLYGGRVVPADVAGQMTAGTGSTASARCCSRCRSGWRPKSGIRGTCPTTPA
jgi:D-alanyl-D-alanine carboxypeptidase